MDDFVFPDVIYLQRNTDGEVTWCAEQQNDDDAEYVRSTLLRDIFAEINRLRKTVDSLLNFPQEFYG